MSDILHYRRASNTSARLRHSFIIYCITILFQALTVQVLANTEDPTYSHIPSKTVNAQVVGGKSATDGEFPYMAAIYKSNSIRCSGVILSSQWVLTEATCLVNKNGTHNPPNFELEAPESEYTIGYGSVKNTTLEHVSISDVQIHPQYEPGEIYNDLALMKLATSLPSSEKWSPARITPKIISSGDKLIAMGWGLIENSEWPSILQKIVLTAGSDSECQSGHPDWDGQDGEFACTISGHGRSLCYGDGGGPLVLPTSPNKNEKFAGYLVGIGNLFVNLDNPESITCGDGGRIANYFTRTAKYVDWIASVMGVNSSELLATPETGSDNDLLDEDDLSDESAASFPMKRFDDTLRLITLCLLALAVIAFNN